MPDVIVVVPIVTEFGPVAPVGPVGPVEPVEPVDPVGPVGPVGPSWVYITCETAMIALGDAGRVGLVSAP